VPRDILPEVVSSRARLKIAHLVSERPRGLGELAVATGISVQGVLKHLRKLKSLGLVEEESVRASGLAVRKVYTAKGAKLGDFSTGDLTLVKLSRKSSTVFDAPDHPPDLEYLAEEAIMQRRRVQDQARRLGRMIDELFEDESRIKTALESMDLTDTERLILEVLFSEESSEEGERVLLERFGLQNGQRSIERALLKAVHRTKKRTGRRPDNQLASPRHAS